MASAIEFYHGSNQSLSILLEKVEVHVHGQYLIFLVFKC